MAARIAEEITYLKDRLVNAIWMIRNGKIKLIAKSIWIEIDHRIRQIRVLSIIGGRTLLQSRRTEHGEPVEPPDSAYNDTRKIAPASYRPTRSQLTTNTRLNIDQAALRRDIDGILASITITEAPTK